MRRTAGVGACIAAFVLLTSALGAPGSISPKVAVNPPTSFALDRPLRQLSAAYPRSLARPVLQHLAIVTAGVPGPSSASGASVRQTPVVHTVQPGDSFWTIAQRSGVTVEGLAAANRLSVTATLRIGQKLMVPARDAVAAAVVPVGGARTPVRATARPAPTTTHVVRSGDTLWEIAKRYGTSVEDLMAWNDLGDSDRIKPGQRLRLATVPFPRHRQVTAQTRSDRPVDADARTIQAAGSFVWPARGVLTSRFGRRYRRHHDGIDIAAPHGTPIYASRDGVVAFSGWKGGYGRVVFLDHGGGMTTVYGHASTLRVRAGQHVKKGQLIATVGCTGSCTGSHVHFEVRVNDRAQNPLPYLTAAQAKR